MIMIVSGLPLISLSMPKTLEAPPTCHKNPAGGGAAQDLHVKPLKMPKLEPHLVLWVLLESSAQIVSSLLCL